MKKIVFKIFIFLSLFLFADAVRANYWLVIGTYRQGPGRRPEVSGITSPTLHTIPMKDIETCKKAGSKISKEIYTPVWQFDNKWTCIYSGVTK
tara:strand:- start:32 stop:310 length:279 start_codon:yes stop_codon:yes gene_type:complete